ncbi:unnamed protein product [Amoebophrya sp. A120]|nr:unnamed protein product [Amoebophrya sp. A120]|eukprot:GSA120T00003714001.1
MIRFPHTNRVSALVVFGFLQVFSSCRSVASSLVKSKNHKRRSDREYQHSSQSKRQRRAVRQFAQEFALSECDTLDVIDWAAECDENCLLGGRNHEQRDLIEALPDIKEGLLSRGVDKDSGSCSPDPGPLRRTMKHLREFNRAFACVEKAGITSEKVDVCRAWATKGRCLRGDNCWNLHLPDDSDCEAGPVRACAAEKFGARTQDLEADHAVTVESKNRAKIETSSLLSGSHTTNHSYAIRSAAAAPVKSDAATSTAAPKQVPEILDKVQELLEDSETFSSTMYHAPLDRVLLPLDKLQDILNGKVSKWGPWIKATVPLNNIFFLRPDRQSGETKPGRLKLRTKQQVAKDATDAKFVRETADELIKNPVAYKKENAMMVVQIGGKFFATDSRVLVAHKKAKPQGAEVNVVMAHVS